MQCPKATMFDLDDTLAESFQPPSPTMVHALKRLLERMPCAIITAAGFQRIYEQFLPELSTSSGVSSLYIFPNSAAECYTWGGSAWQRAYTFGLTPEERASIKATLKEEADKVMEAHPSYAWQIIDREAQVAFAAVGLEAPLEVKKTWDPDQAKRKRLKSALEIRLPDFEVLIGGMTTIDITRKGINKSYGVEWLAKEIGAATGDMLYVGDALYPGGNDYVVIDTGVATRKTSGPEETLRIIEEVLASCGAKKPPPTTRAASLRAELP